MKKWFMVLLTLIVVAVVGVGVSAAQTETPTPPTTPETSTAHPCARLSAALRGGEMFAGRQRPLLQAIMDATHLTLADLLADRRGGKSLADVISENGGNVDSIIAQAVAAETAQISTSVTNGRLTQAQADRLIAALQPLYERIVNGQWQQQMIYERIRAGLVLLAAQETGLRPEDVASQIRGGASLADVLTAHNVNVDTFINGAAARVQARLNVLVVDGTITQAQADQDLAKFRDALTQRINNPGGAASTATPEAADAAWLFDWFFDFEPPLLRRLDVFL
jgi:hypothetical protein